MCIVLRQGQPLADNIFLSTERPYHFANLLQVSKTSLKSDFIHIFNDFIHVYSPKAGTDNPLGTKFSCQQKRPNHFAHLLQVSKNLFEV